MSGGELRRTIVIAAGVTVTIVIAFVLLRVDISAMRDFERDVILLREPLPRTSHDRYHDPSPFNLWLPSDLFIRDSIRRGEVPFWNRHQGGGYSVTNAIHEGSLHPVRWLMALVPAQSAPSILIVVILAMAFTGMMLVTRSEAAASRVASLAGAFIFTFSAVLLSYVHFSGGLLPLAHIPWLILFLRRRWLAAASLGFASLAASGHPLLVACAAATAGSVMLADAFASRSLGPIGFTALTGFAGALIAAPALLPPLLSRADLWTYKTTTAQGVSYFAYSLQQWIGALESMGSDTWTDAACCIDLDHYYLHVGLAVIALAAAGDFVLRGKRILVLLVAAFVVAVPGPWMASIAAVRPLSFFKPWYLIGAMIFFLAWLAASGFDALWRGRRVFRVLAIGLVAIVSVSYGVRAWRTLQPRVTRDFPQGEALQFLRRQPAPFRVVSLWGQTHMPNASTMTEVEDIRLAGPVLTRRYHLWWDAVDPGVLSRAYPTTRITDRLDSPLVADFNVRYVIQSRLAPAGTFRFDPDPRRRDELLAPGVAHFPVVARTPWVEIREIPGARPRAHFASGAGRVAVRYPTDRTVVLDAESRDGGVVVLHDTYAAGWTATVGGRETEIIPVNILSRGVMVPAGRHRIEMRYTPPGFHDAVALSAASILGLVLIERRRRVA